jgi:hypothetical protein
MEIKMTEPNEHFVKMVKLLEKALTPEAFALFLVLEKKIPEVWDKYSSSSMKYHKRADGSVPTLGEHTYEMVYAAVKVIRLFPGKTVSRLNDARILAIVLHDRVKYGIKGNLPHTVSNHDKLMADIIHKQRPFFQKIFTVEEIALMEEMIRYHSGQWSTDAKNKPFDWASLKPEILFIHLFDMLSTADCLKYS